MTSMPTRVDRELYDAAQSSGATNSRSAAQQINHWARIGRELEAGNLGHRDIERVLAGELSYDHLGILEQAIVRAKWDRDMEQTLASLDLEAEFTAAGETWAEGDGEGGVVIRGESH